MPSGGNITSKLVKLALTFVGAEVIVVVAHNLRSIGLEAGEDFSALSVPN